jgi:YD repeat-containing protein
VDGVTSTTGYNGEQLSTTYDPTTGRPLTGTSPFGGVTYYSYSALGTIPLTQKVTGPSGVTITTLDGLGRPILVQHGDSATVDSTTSFTSTVYEPCACSPLGKIQKVSMPYASGGTEYWTTYTYDGRGRPVSVQKPDGASTTTYSYLGNQTTVTDPALNWKTSTTDVLGNLITVLEPDPSNLPSGTVTTTYSYDWMNHAACVDMDRGGTITTAYTYTSNGITCTTVYTSGTGTRQTRTFVYSDAGLLTSAANPENGLVSYYYNTTNTLQRKHDAKGQDFVYTYDTSNRVLEIQKYPLGQSYAEDLCARVAYVYGTNVASYNYGRLTSASYSYSSSCGYTYPFALPPYSESYTYGAPGNVVSKTVSMPQSGQQSIPAPVNYGYDTYGRVTSVRYQVCPLAH